MGGGDLIKGSYAKLRRADEDGTVIRSSKEFLVEKPLGRVALHALCLFAAGGSGGIFPGLRGKSGKCSGRDCIPVESAPDGITGAKVVYLLPTRHCNPRP